MTSTHVSRDPSPLAAVESPDQADLDGLPRFRAESYEDAVRAATDELGANFRVAAASRIRRGGIGGFFATDLGVEIIVMPTDDTGADLPPDARSPDARSTDAAADHADDPAGDPADERSDDYGNRRAGASSLTDTRLRQLLDAAERGDRSNVPASTVAELRTFADHLDHEIRRTASPATAPDATGPESEPADSASREPVEAAMPMIDPIAIPTLPPRVPSDEEIAAPAEPACPVIGEPLLHVPAAAPPARPKRSTARRGATDDPLRRPTQLAAAATDRLVTKLGRIAPVEGSKLHELNRVRVAVTTPDGTQIEMTAELGLD